MTGIWFMLIIGLITLLAVVDGSCSGPQSTPTAPNIITATSTPAPVLSPSPTPLPSENPTPLFEPSASPTPEPTTTQVSDPSTTPTPAPSASPTVTPTPLPSENPIPPSEPSASPTPVPTTTQVSEPSTAPSPVYTYKVVNSYPHDEDAFTQGLVFESGLLYEGTGIRGQSTLRSVELVSGEVLQTRELAPQFFGEGVAIHGDRLIQLTWQSNVGFVYDRDSFELLREFNYPTEGWGITYDGRRLIMSDGTSTLRLVDAETFDETGRIEVFAYDGPVAGLNELEYIHGEIYANVFPTDRIARIEPQTGRVIGWIDLSGLLSAEHRTERAGVLNGIAYDGESDRLFLTGKRWPKLYEVELVPQE